MFREIRFQTGEINEIIGEMKKGNIPCMDVADTDEFNWFLEMLASNSIYRAENIPYDKNARNRVKEPEFEFRVAFCNSLKNTEEFNNSSYMYIDFYFEPDIDETYDSILGD